MKGPVDEKLAFEAMRYALEEMRPSEREAFEDRLLEDQAAREAVVDAVAICQAMKEMFDRTMAQPELGQMELGQMVRRADWRPLAESAAAVDGLWRRRAVWASLALAASVMIAVVLSDIGRDRGRHAQQLAQPAVGDNSSSLDGMSDRGKQLAVAWLNFLPSPNDLTAQTEGDGFDSDDLNAMGADEVALVDPAGDTSASPTDDWLFEAVTAPAAETSSPAITPLEG